jgi:hypothetical protein
VGNESQRLKELCEKFIYQEYDIEEFQSRIETAVFPIEAEGKKQGILNELEEIRFTKLESNHYSHGAEVARKILDFLKE